MGLLLFLIYFGGTAIAQLPSSSPSPRPAFRSNFADEPSKLERIGFELREYIDRKIFEDHRFFHVNLDQPESLDTLDEQGHGRREEFNEFMLKHLTKGAEAYLIYGIDPDAERLEDLIPDSWNTTLKEGKSFLRIRLTEPDRKEAEPPQYQEDSLANLPFEYFGIESMIGELEELVPGDFRVRTRLRPKNVECELSWKPLPKELPLRLGYEFEHRWSDQTTDQTVSVSVDLLGWMEIPYGRRRRPHFYITAEHYLSEANSDRDGDSWFGIMFTSY